MNSHPQLVIQKKELSFVEFCTTPRHTLCQVKWWSKLVFSTTNKNWQQQGGKKKRFGYAIIGMKKRPEMFWEWKSCCRKHFSIHQRAEHLAWKIICVRAWMAGTATGISVIECVCLAMSLAAESRVGPWRFNQTQRARGLRAMNGDCARGGRKEREATSNLVRLDLILCGDGRARADQLVQRLFRIILSFYLAAVIPTESKTDFHCCSFKFHIGSFFFSKKFCQLKISSIKETFFNIKFKKKNKKSKFQNEKY